MAVVHIKQQPDLTAEKAMEIFKKGFAGKYEVYKWTRTSLLMRDFVVKKSSLIGVAVKLKQENDQTSFVLAWESPSWLLSRLVMLVLPWISIILIFRPGGRAVENEVKTFIENVPEFK